MDATETKPGIFKVWIGRKWWHGRARDEQEARLKAEIRIKQQKHGRGSSS